MFWAHRYDQAFVGMIMFSMCRKKQQVFRLFEADLRTNYVNCIRPKMEYNSHLWTGASKNALDFVDRIQSQGLKRILDHRVASSITFLEHRRNVSCIVLLYKYYFGKCFSALSELIIASGIRKKYQAVQKKPRCHCCDHVPPHNALQGKSFFYPYCTIAEQLTNCLKQR